MANSKHTEQFHYEFMGPYGPLVIILALPLVVLGLSYACNPQGCLQLSLSGGLSVPGFPEGTLLYTHEAMMAVLGWVALVLALHLLLPGQVAHGVQLPSGKRLAYKLNGESGSCRFALLTCLITRYQCKRHPASWMQQCSYTSGRYALGKQGRETVSRAFAPSLAVVVWSF